MHDDDLVAALDALRAADALRTVLPFGSRDRDMIEALVHSLDGEIRRHLDGRSSDGGRRHLRQATDAATRAVERAR